MFKTRSSRDFKSFEQVVVYACGSSAMINDAFRLLTSRGLPPENFFLMLLLNHTERRNYEGGDLGWWLRDQT